VIETDFPAWTPELLAYLGPGGVSPSNPRLFTTYRAAVRELFDDIGADALSVRIGEGGGAYDDVESGYASTVNITTVGDVQRLIAELLGEVERWNERTGGDRKLLFRCWTIGIGEIGRLHTSPALYERVFAPFHGRPALMTLMKHVAQDFFDYAPRNPIIGRGAIPQIVEVQARREFEGFNLFPNYRGEGFAEDLAALRAMPRVAGLSIWATNGGFPWERPSSTARTGPTSGSTQTSTPTPAWRATRRSDPSGRPASGRSGAAYRRSTRRSSRACSSARMTPSARASTWAATRRTRPRSSGSTSSRQ
jgi:hypothetical protein